MLNPLISICYFPTTVVLLDDQRSFVDSLVSTLGNRFPLKVFTSSLKARDFFLKEYSIQPFSQLLISSEDEYSDRLAMSIDARMIEQRVYDSQRFAEVGVLVTDQAMPEVEGLDVCRALGRHCMRIIMLTGEMGNEFAVQAFNQGLIHHFMLKSTANRNEMLIKAIIEQQMRYFLEQSNSILDATKYHSKNLIFQLSDAVFAKFFQDLCHAHGIIEHYLLDNEGSFLLVNKDGKCSILLLKNADALNDYLEFAIGAEGTPPSVKNALKERTHVPLFYKGYGLEAPPPKWDPYLHPAKILEGENDTYYYAYLEDAGRFGVKTSDVLGYQMYLESLC